MSDNVSGSEAVSGPNLDQSPTSTEEYIVGLEEERDELWRKYQQLQIKHHRQTRLFEELKRDRDELGKHHAEVVHRFEALSLEKASLEQSLTAQNQATLPVQLRSVSGRLKQVAQKGFSGLARREATSLEGRVDVPAVNASLSSPFEVSGWAVTEGGVVTEVAVFLGERWLGVAQYGLERPDVVAARPWQRLTACGFRQQFSPNWELTGPQNLRVVVRDNRGNSRTFSQLVQITETGGPKPQVRQSNQFQPEVSLELVTAERPDKEELYLRWILANEPQAVALRQQRATSQTWGYRPLISILTPVYNTPPQVLRETFQSVLSQTYDNWELCLVDGASTRPGTRAVLAELANKDRRVRLHRLEDNLGISKNSQVALEMARGEFVTMLDHDDIIPPFALFEVGKLLNRQPQADLIYSDEDKISEEGERYEPFFKPGWSPDLLQTMMYISHLAVYRTALMREVGGFRADFEGTQDYDLALRVAERTDQIYHIPQVLYHWRAVAGSAAQNLGAKPYARQAQIRAVTDQLQRRGVAGVVGPGMGPYIMQLRYNLADQPLASLLIGTGGTLPRLRQMLESIRQRTAYRHYEILVAENKQAGPEMARYLEELAQSPDCRIVTALDRDNPKENLAEFYNRAANLAQGAALLFLAPDLEVVNPEWLTVLLEQAMRPEIGAVGARLLYPDYTLRHAGLVLGLNGLVGRRHHHLPADDPGYFGLPRTVQNVSAVSAECLMTRRELFEAAGGFEAQNLPEAYFEVDYCLKQAAAGRRVVWTPYAELYRHIPSKPIPNSSQAATEAEESYLRQHWAEVIAAGDPYYSPNLSLIYEDFRIEPTPAPHR